MPRRRDLRRLQLCLSSALTGTLCLVAACDERLRVIDSDAANRETPDAGSERADTGTAAQPDADSAVAKMDAAIEPLYASAPRDASEPEDAAMPDAAVERIDAGRPPRATVAEPESEEDDAGAPPATAADGGRAQTEPSSTEPQTREEPLSALPHDFFSTAFLEDGVSATPIGSGDLWPSCWSDDDALYAAGGDGAGFDLAPREYDVFVARIDGTPANPLPMAGTTLSTEAQVSSIWSGSDYNRKPTGMLCLDGDLYLAVQDLRRNTFSDAPAATIVRSSDKGLTWSWDREAPMFSDHAFTTIMFLDFGKDAEHAPPDYVYAYGLDDNWDFQVIDRTPPTELYLARVPHAAVQDRARWEFFTGFDEQGAPEWSADIDERAPVLEDTRLTYTMPLEPGRHYQNMTVINQGGVVYNAPLARYLYTSWTEYTFEFYEAPEPWGPWKLFLSKDFGLMPWTRDRSGGYATTIPSKFISADGRSMWVQANAWLETGVNSYNFSLRELTVNAYGASEAMNARSPRSLATESDRAVPIGRAFRLGHPERLNDGTSNSESEDSWTGERKTADYWGYTWPKAFRFDKLRYTTGQKTSEGGWFEDLTVQVRRGQTWVPVTNLRIDPSYSRDVKVPDFTTYTLTFDAISGDGVRLFGKPGGTGAFTAISELSVHYE
jgi:hypothetical protein